MEKKYNGFNDGLNASSGVGGREPFTDMSKMIVNCKTCRHREMLNDAGSGLRLDCYGCNDYSHHQFESDNLVNNKIEKDKEKIEIDDIIKIINDLKAKEVKRDGFILLPSANGFDIFKISEERLKLYLQAESMNNVNK